MKYRPREWEVTMRKLAEITLVGDAVINFRDLVEAGADAMLEGLREELAIRSQHFSGKKGERIYVSTSTSLKEHDYVYSFPLDKDGCLVFISDEYINTK